MASAAPRRTKIVATIGPASASPETLVTLAGAGMDAARLNFSHGSREEHAERARSVRAAQDEVGRPLALIADLQGPKLRVGHLPHPMSLIRNEEAVIVFEPVGRDGEVPVLPAVLGEVLLPGQDLLIDDGHIHLRVEEVEHGRARCTVLAGGVVSANKGVNVPGVPVPIPSLTQKDREDLELAVELGVDFVALSFVRSAEDVREMRKLLADSDPEVHVIAKIEKAEAIDALEEIVREADAIMVARGDLGVEIGPASVPLLQKRIILSALDRGKTVITATQMLESMEHRPEPTRAEASDVANAVLDGSSALMLSGETAIGEYPVESVEYMDRIVRAVEPSLGYRHQLPEASDEPTVGNAMSNAACDLAEAVGAKAILVPTFTGRTASAVARLRPTRPIIGITHHRHAVQQMAVEWGVTPIEIAEASDVEDLWARSLEAARESGIVEPGDRVVITAGTAVNIPGSTNVIKVDVA
jgi:pyruvate kinase